MIVIFFFFFQAEDGIRDLTVTGVQTCALPILRKRQAPAVRNYGNGAIKMQRGSKARHPLLKRGLTALAMLASPSALYAQSCALCYQSAAHSGAHFIQALKHGILFLLFPPLCIGTGIAIMAYRKRNQHAEGWRY